MADVSADVGQAHLANSRYPLRFQAAKQPFHRRIIPAVTPPAHVLAYPITPKPLAEQATGVLADGISPGLAPD